MSKAASDTDISDASSDESTIDYVFPTTGSSSTPAHEVGLSQVLKLRGGSFAGLKIKRWDFRRSYKNLKTAVVLRPDWQNFFTVSVL